MWATPADDALGWWNCTLALANRFDPTVDISRAKRLTIMTHKWHLSFPENAKLQFNFLAEKVSTDIALLFISGRREPYHSAGKKITVYLH
jgi:hypothetical protein